MTVCTKCQSLMRVYACRVRAFLKDPPPEWMRACGYDADYVRFSRDCEIWKQAVCKDPPEEK